MGNGVNSSSRQRCSTAIGSGAAERCNGLDGDGGRAGGGTSVRGSCGMDGISLSSRRGETDGPSIKLSKSGASAGVI